MKSIPVHQTAITREDLKRANRFRDAALPHLDSIYTLARYLLSDPSDAEEAVQECYRRALRHFDTSRNSEIKPWLFAVLRNVCCVEYRRRSRELLYDVNMESDSVEDAIPVGRDAGFSSDGDAA
jgi:DNA-directed RNA polymerase specialized sigma24 family protein